MFTDSKDLADRGLKAVYKLLKGTQNMYDPDIKLNKCSLYDKLVLPVIHYNFEIWEVERTHLLFCKKLLKLNSRTADYFICCELVWVYVNIKPTLLYYKILVECCKR